MPGYNGISKYDAREARQRRMLKTEAFELESTSHLTDKQRRKLEKKQERERKKEKNMTTKKQKKMMKEMDENVDLRKIDQYVLNALLAHMKPINSTDSDMLIQKTAAVYSWRLHQ